MRFNNNTILELEQYLLKCYIHDSEIVDISSSTDGKIIEFKFINSFFKKEYVFQFRNLECFIFKKSHEYGSNRHVSSLTVEKGGLLFDRIYTEITEKPKECIALCLETFSGNRYSILTEEICIAEISAGDGLREP